MLQSVAYYGVLAIESLFGVFGIRLYEAPSYIVIDRIEDRIEIRRYRKRIAAEVALTASDAGENEAFSMLFAYIAGANRTADGSDGIAMTVPVEVDRSERIAMTVPVEADETRDAVRMRFFLPGKYSIDTAPQPADERVRLVVVQEETIAALRFSGSGTDAEERKSELVAALSATKWPPRGRPYLLFYDAPFTLPFVRRNEAAVTVSPAG